MRLPRELVKEPRTIEPTANAMDAARRMERFGVGSLIVVEDRRPVGIVTDRDLALFVLEGELDPAACTVADCMNAELVVLPLDAGVDDAVLLLRRHGIRRLPIVDAKGELAGVVTADDMLQLLAHDLSDLAAVVRNELGRRSSRSRDGSAVFGRE